MWNPARHASPDRMMISSRSIRRTQDEEKEHEYNGKMYKGKALLDLWCSEADQAKEKFKAYEKANKSPAKKQKTDKPKSDKSDKSDGASAKGRRVMLR